MKNLILLLSLFIVTETVNGQNNWNIGIQLGALGNSSKFSAGMTDANALFTNNCYGSGQIGFYTRKTINSHFSFQTGFDFSQLGFSYSIAKDYSLLKERDLCPQINIGTCITRIPTSIIYNSKPNCKNVRFIMGIGIAIVAIDNHWDNENMATDEISEIVNSGISNMNAEAHSTSKVSGSFTTLIGCEKVFSRGNMLSFTLQGNCGFAPLAESSVTYLVNNKNYNHVFTNDGSFCGFALCYYFLPVGSKKAIRNSALPSIK